MRTLIAFLVLLCSFQSYGRVVPCPIDSVSDTTLIQGVEKIIIQRIDQKEEGSLSLNALIKGSIALASINHAEPVYGNARTSIIGNKFTIELVGTEWKIMLFERNQVNHIEVSSSDAVRSASLQKEGGIGRLSYAFGGQIFLTAKVEKVKYANKGKVLIISYSLD